LDLKQRAGFLSWPFFICKKILKTFVKVNERFQAANLLRKQKGAGIKIA
jgi:hypothetical protein